MRHLRVDERVFVSQDYTEVSEMANTFQVGDVVQLRSGGPKMTVIAAGPDGNGKPEVWCTWFPEKNGKPEHGSFPVEAIQRF